MDSGTQCDTAQNGNIKHSSPSATARERDHSARFWFFTWNNFPESAQTLFKDLPVDLAPGIVLQHEVGEKSGLNHLQGVIKFAKEHRPFEDKRFPKTIWWDKIRNNEAARDYCIKSATRKEGGYSYIRGAELFKNDEIKPKKKRKVTKYDKIENLWFELNSDFKLNDRSEPDKVVSFFRRFIRECVYKHRIVNIESEKKMEELVEYSYNYILKCELSWETMLISQATAKKMGLEVWKSLI